MLLNPLTHSFLLEPTEGDPTGGVPPAVVPPAGPDLSQILGAITGITKTITDLKSGFEARFNAVDSKFKTFTDELSDTVLSSPAVTPSTSADPAAPTPVQPSSNDGDAIALKAFRRRLKESEDKLASMAAENEATKKRERAIRLESAVNAAMNGLAWADGASELVAKDIVSRAEIDDDGKVKISGEDPKKYITNWHTANRWAQPPAVNAGSGNVPGSRPGSQFIDVASIDPAKLVPGSDDWNKLLAQTRRSIGQT